MPIHPDFEKILKNFIKQYGDKKGREYFYAWINKHNLNPDKPYRNADQLYECTGELCESFRWVDEPLIQFYKADEDATLWKVVALTANVSQNKNDYTDVEVFKNTAASLSWRPLDWNHDHSLMLPFPEARTELARFEDNAVETIIRIPNNLYHYEKHVLVNDMIRNGDILHVSIEGTPRGGKITSKGVAPQNWNFTGLALLERDVTLPGDPLTYIEPLFLNESMGRSLVESLMEDRRDIEDMTEPEYEEKPEELATELATELAEDYEGIQGISVCGQCMYFEDLTNATQQLPHLTGVEPDSVVITRTSGGIGAGIGICQVATRLTGSTTLVRKNDSACTDGRPRTGPTDVDRIKEKITLDEIEKIALIAEHDRRIADRDAKILEELGKTSVEREEKLKALKQVAERDITLKDKQREIATLTSNNVRLKEDVTKLRDDLDKLREEISGLRVSVAAKDADVKHYKDRYDAYERTYKELSNEVIMLKERLTDAISKRDESLEKTATHRQQTINAETDKARIQGEYALVMEQLSNTTREVSDSAEIRSAQAKQQLKDTQEILKLREQVEEMKEAIRKLKQQLTKRPSRIKVKG